jgi:hypothetical protein
MDSPSVQARIEHEIAQLRARFPQVIDCHTALVHWKDGGAARYSLYLDIRWPNHQTLVSGRARDSAEGAISTGFIQAKEALQ